LSNKKLLALGVKAPKTTPESGIRILRVHAKIPEQSFFTRIKQWFPSNISWINKRFAIVRFWVRSFCSSIVPKGAFFSFYQ
jgi:hypothetical protein